MPSPNLGKDPNVDFKENSPHQEGIITEMYVTRDQSLPRAAPRLEKISKYFKSSAEIPSKTGRYRQKP